MARRLFQLVEPVAVVTYMADEPTEAVMALGLPTMWDAYFAGRAAPLGREVPAAVVHALFYNFAVGEVARHIPRVWDLVTPEAAIAAREQGSVATLRRILDVSPTPPASPVPPTSSPRRGPAPRRRDGPSTRRSGRCPCPPNRWRGSGTGPTCFASTVATAMSPPS